MYRSCKLAVATHCKLNAAKGNAILVPTWYSGTRSSTQTNTSLSLSPGRRPVDVATQRAPIPPLRRQPAFFG